MTIRAKFKLASIRSYADTATKMMMFEAVWDQSIPEDQRFQKAKPCQQFEIAVDNPDVLDQLILGQAYYVDLTPAVATEG